MSKPKSQAEAISKVKALAGKGIDTENSADADVPVSGARYNDPGLPEISLSPAMTLKGIEPGCGIEIVIAQAIGIGGEPFGEPDMGIEQVGWTNGFSPQQRVEIFGLGRKTREERL